jgi:hypothetical protein
MDWFRAFVIWFVLIAVETVQGVLRTALLQPVVGDFRARQIAVFTGALIILAVAYLFSRWLGVTSVAKLLGIGVFWLFLTLLFEVVLGRFVLGLTWSRIGSDYDLSRGGLLPIGLVALTLSPLIAVRLRSRKSDGRKSEGSA